MASPGQFQLLRLFQKVVPVCWFEEVCKEQAQEFRQGVYTIPGWRG